MRRASAPKIIYDAGTSMKIRPAEPKDRSRIREILVATARFTEDAVRAAVELVDHFLEHGPRSEYLTFLLDSPQGGPSRMIQGYVPYGATRKTEGALHH